MTATIFRSLSAALAIAAALLAGCGGGGGGGGGDDMSNTPGGGNPPVAATGPFALATGYQALISAGENNNFGLSGSCNGSATITNAAATTAATFEGVAGFSAGQVSTINLTNCQPATGTTTGTSYYNSARLPIGFAIAGGEYAVAAATPTAIPASVMVGGSGPIATLTSYSDNTKATVTGKRVISYLVEADTSTTAIANVMTRSFNTADQLLSTQQSRYRMMADGSLKLISITVDFTTTSTQTNNTVTLLYTAR